MTVPTTLRVLLLIAVGLAGYVIGAKAGRSRYREISRTARRVWDDPAVKRVRTRTYRKVEKAAKRAAKRLGV